MLPTTIDEIEQGFCKAKNLNSALKGFLKREGSANPQAASFAKDFRAAAGSGKAPAIRAFVERNYPKREIFFVGLARYAHPELVESVVGRIIDTHADAFNATYDRGENGIKVTDAATFKKIVKEVDSIIEQGLKGAELPPSNFMKSVLLASVFEPDVLGEALKVLGAR